MTKKTKGAATEADKKIGQNLRTIRLFRDNMSQQTLAESIGITFQQIQKYEKGTNRISGGRFIELAKALDVRVEAFFDGISNFNEFLVVPEMSKRQRDIMNILMHIDNPEIEKSFLAILKHHHTT